MYIVAIPSLKTMKIVKITFHCFVYLLVAASAVVVAVVVATAAID